MSTNRHRMPGTHPLLILLLTLFAAGCSTYTVKTHYFARSIRHSGHKMSGLSLNSVSGIRKGKNHNTLDTVSCYDSDGNVRTKKFTYDSKITVVTKDNREIRYYVKTLYIWKDQFLIGERTKMSFNGPNYFPVRLEDISRIEIKGL